MYDQEISQSRLTRLASKVQTQGPEDQDQSTKDQGTRGPRDQRTKGPEDQGTTGPRDQWTNGPGQREESCFVLPRIVQRLDACDLPDLYTILGNTVADETAKLINRQAFVKQQIIFTFTARDKWKTCYVYTNTCVH